MLGTILKQDEIFPIWHGPQFSHPGEIYESRTVNPGESRWIELPFEGCHSFGNQMSVAIDMKLG